MEDKVAVNSGKSGFCLFKGNKQAILVPFRLADLASSGESDVAEAEGESHVLSRPAESDTRTDTPAGG
jgi:hypothetical protein